MTMRDGLTFGDGVRFGLGFLVAQVIFTIIVILAFVFFGAVLMDMMNNYNSSNLNDVANDFGNGVGLFLISRFGV